MKERIKQLLREQVAITPKQLRFERWGVTRFGVYMDGVEDYVASVGIAMEGNVPLDPHDVFEKYGEKVYPNSMFFAGGFIVKREFQKQGIGKAIIQKLFMDKPELQNIFLYAVEWQGAIPFWKRIGGKVILQKGSGSVYIQLERNAVLS